MDKKNSCFDLNCQQCPRLAQFLLEQRRDYPDYHARPVPPFGVSHPGLLIVGLAPGMHGANATGRPFTGDFAGILLYQTLYKYGFSTKAESVSATDDLQLKNCRITNAVKCLPPQNKPTLDEIKTCNQYLIEELKTVPENGVILVLGSIAHNAVVRASGLKIKDYPFGHNVCKQLPSGRWLLSSYHCSRYNTQTKRLTEKMFHAVFVAAKKKLAKCV